MRKYVCVCKNLEANIEIFLNEKNEKFVMKNVLEQCYKQ